MSRENNTAKSIYYDNLLQGAKEIHLNIVFEFLVPFAWSLTLEALQNNNQGRELLRITGWGSPDSRHLIPWIIYWVKGCWEQWSVTMLTCVLWCPGHWWIMFPLQTGIVKFKGLAHWHRCPPWLFFFWTSISMAKNVLLFANWSLAWANIRHLQGNLRPFTKRVWFGDHPDWAWLFSDIKLLLVGLQLQQSVPKDISKSVYDITRILVCILDRSGKN